MKIVKILVLLTLMCCNVNSLPAQPTSTNSQVQPATYVTGKIEDRLTHNTIILVLHGPFFYDGAPERGASQVLMTTVSQNGEFKFKVLNGTSAFHVSLFLSSKRDGKSGRLLGSGDIDDYLIEPGDSINITFNKGKQLYSGKGAALFQVQYDVEQVDKDRHLLTFDTLDYFNNDSKKWLKQKDSLLDVQLGVLTGYKSKLSPTAYAVVRADIIGVNRAWLYRRINFAGPFLSRSLVLSRPVGDLCTELERRPSYIDSSDRAALSPKYVNYLYEKLRIEVKYDRVIHGIDVRSDENYFPFIARQYTGILLDKLLAWWLTRITSFNDLQPEYLTKALAVMQTPYFIKMVDDLQATYGSGQPITDFNFKDANDRTVHLADFKGKVLLLDFWFSGCHGCVEVAGGMPQVEDAFKNRTDISFISISIDKDKNTWLKSIDKNHPGRNYTHYTTARATYLYTGGTAGNNPFIEKYVPDGSYPSLLIVDKEGKVFSSTPARPITPNGQKELIKEINEALHEKN